MTVCSNSGGKQGRFLTDESIIGPEKTITEGDGGFRLFSPVNWHIIAILNEKVLNMLRADKIS